MRYIVVLLIAFTIAQACHSPAHHTGSNQVEDKAGVELLILGTIQDAGSPQIGCTKSCCVDLWTEPDPSRMVSSIGVIDHDEKKNFLIEATPDIKRQLQYLNQHTDNRQATPNGILLTHAHMGHYTGLMHLGKEAIGAKEVNVYAMPKMRTYLSENGPWDQLITEKNIMIQSLHADSIQILTQSLSIIPMTVPHRDEYSETVGYKIIGPNKSALFIPDIDKWHLWHRSIISEIAKADYAFLDATFYDGNELGGRDMSLIPHPFVAESMELFDQLSKTEKAKIYFIHLNHTNPLLDTESPQYIKVEDAGFQIARFGQSISL